MVRTTNIIAGQVYYEAMPEMHRIQNVLIDGKPVEFRVVIDIFEPRKKGELTVITEPEIITNKKKALEILNGSEGGEENEQQN